MSIFHQTEAVIKSETTKMYKEAFGHGPTNTAVHVWENILTIKLFGALTKLEESLLTTAEGEKLVHEIREHLAKNSASLFRQRLEEELSNRIGTINYWLDKGESILYIFVIFRERIFLKQTVS